ncbi:cystatin-F [Pygocentrus nattereri]|uniref:Cystatin domain-containing protein n=1 Tax=Pygocentrus nattereri TaxID=42514 RepID=A0AAR2JLE3_PYGNA|nr:cystatin-F [Pygocentrus nattereri]XP_037394200.1 cystatin-F [Pygocentrus nattereri]
MDVCYHLLLVFLLAGFCSIGKWSADAFESRLVPGKPLNVSKNDTDVKKAVQTATYSFNNRTNDAYFFKASAIEDAQRQIVKGIKYLLKVEISRTVCRKRESDVDLANCAFQPHGLLQQTFLCNFEVWAIPWLKIMKTTFCLCLPLDKS